VKKIVGSSLASARRRKIASALSLRLRLGDRSAAFRLKQRQRALKESHDAAGSGGLSVRTRHGDTRLKRLWMIGARMVTSDDPSPCRPLALAGWYLMAPLDPGKLGPLSSWRIIHSYDPARQCAYDRDRVVTEIEGPAKSAAFAKYNPGWNGKGHSRESGPLDA
jgi:hypothetical protein